MFKQIQKGLAFLAVILVFACMPQQAQADETPVFAQKYSVFYENRANKGIYDITVKNVKKGYILKWHITGKGKKYASFDTAKTIAQGNSVTNKLTINSNGEQAYAAAERIRITVNVYTAKWKLVDKPTFAGRLQSKAKAIDIDVSKAGDLTMLTAGRSYEFQAPMTPANATSRVYWQAADAAGADYSAQIKDGVFTPLKEGSYTITASAKNTEKGAVLCSKTVSVRVGGVIESVDQTAADGVHITFHTAAASNYKENDFTIKSGEATVLVKKVKYSEDGKTAYLTTASNFIDGRTYAVTCAGCTKEFTASVGKPAALSILTTTAQAEKFTTISYVLLDAKGIDVTGTVDGTFLYTANVNNGYLDQKTNRLYMTTVGNIASVTLDYTSPDGSVRLTDTKTIICIAPQAEVAKETNFTLTNSPQEPAYKDEDVRSVAVGDTMYAHFRGLNDEENAITYDSVTYASSDPDRLIISSDGRVTPIKPGPVTVVVTAKQGSDSIPYTYQITVNAARYLAAVRMKETAVTMSNTYLPSYQKEIAVTAADQYGGSFSLVHASGVVTSASGQKLLASYDAAGSQVVIRAQGADVGTYSYTLTLTADGVSVKQNFTVMVSAPVLNGTVSYKAEASRETADLSVTESTAADQSIRVRLAEYRGGVFYGYKYFVSAEIRKGSVYYSNDLITSTTGSAIRLPGSDILTLTPMTIEPGADADGISTCRKAEPGVYTVTMTYVDSAYQYKTENISITITDGQNPPEYTLRSLTASAAAANALQLVNDCIYVPNGSILDCTATGTRLTGSAIPLTSGEQLHIDTITVKSVVTTAAGQKVYVTHVIKIDKTFTNK